MCRITWLLVGLCACGTSAERSPGDPPASTAETPTAADPTTGDPGFTVEIVDPDTLLPVADGDPVDLLWTYAQPQGHLWYAVSVTGSSGTVEIDPYVSLVATGEDVTNHSSDGYFALAPGAEPGEWELSPAKAILVPGDYPTFESLLDGQDVLLEVVVTDLTSGESASASAVLTGAVSVFY